MADRASVSMLIGGVVPPHLVETFLETIAAEGGFDGWEGTPIGANSLDHGGPLEICGYEKSGGVFEELEAFCVDHGLAFVRTSGSCPGAFGPERVVYNGRDGPWHYLLDEDNRVVIDRSTLDRLGSLESARVYFDDADFAPPPLSRG